MRGRRPAAGDAQDRRTRRVGVETRGRWRRGRREGRELRRREAGAHAREVRRSTGRRDAGGQGIRERELEEA